MNKRVQARINTQKAITEAIEKGFEVCIAAANRFDGQVWIGHRHIYSMDAMHDELGYHMSRKEMMDKAVTKDSGFITSKNRYVDREEGLKLQKAAGIPSAALGNDDDYRPFDLFSEDLY